MNTNNTDDKIKQLFQQQKKQDELNAPAFNMIMQKKAQPSLYIMNWRMAFAAAVIFIFLVSMPFITKIKTYTETAKNRNINLQTEKQNANAEITADLTQWESLTNWEASSDSLLAVSGNILGSEFKTSTDSWFVSASDESETAQ